MDQERERIQADLRGLLDGDVRCDDVFVQMYATDASIYEIRPLGVVRPRGVADVVACVQYAAENEIPLHARGARAPDWPASRSARGWSSTSRIPCAAFWPATRTRCGFSRASCCRN